jgi:hypothetical protein
MSGQPRTSPPLRVDSTIQMAWGLTLNFSSDAKENTVGTGFLSMLEGLRQQYQNDPNTQAYLDNLCAEMSGYLRTSGYERDAYVKYLDKISNRRDASVSNINDISDLASTSSSGLLAKISAFLGIGSLAQLVGIITSTALPTPGLPFNLTAVLVGGLGGLALFVLIVRLTRPYLTWRADYHCFRRQQDYWEHKARPGFVRELIQLAGQLRKLVRGYYPKYTEETLTMAEGELRSLIDSFLPSADLYFAQRASGSHWFSPDYEWQSQSTS